LWGAVIFFQYGASQPSAKTTKKLLTNLTTLEICLPSPKYQSELCFE
jgi:hypothetical protein